MNKRYIDFVPVNGDKPVKKQVDRNVVVKKMPTPRSSVSRNAAVKTHIVREIPKKSAARTVIPKQNKAYGETSRPINKTKASFSLDEGPKFGVIEDLNSKFVKTEVPKRPLSGGTISSAGTGGAIGAPKADAKEIKSKKIGGRRAKKSVEKSVERSNKRFGKKDEIQTFKTPRTPFINQENVVKRPLSKNVYQKKIEPTKEKNSGPITIISKPEKDSNVGIVVAIILTVVLGAAAGTIAFLLLPK